VRTLYAVEISDAKIQMPPSHHRAPRLHRRHHLKATSQHPRIRENIRPQHWRKKKRRPRAPHPTKSRNIRLPARRRPRPARREACIPIQRQTHIDRGLHRKTKIYVAIQPKNKAKKSIISFLNSAKYFQIVLNFAPIILYL